MYSAINSAYILFILNDTGSEAWVTVCGMNYFNYLENLQSCRLVHMSTKQCRCTCHVFHEVWPCCGRVMCPWPYTGSGKCSRRGDCSSNNFDGLRQTALNSGTCIHHYCATQTCFTKLFLNPGGMSQIFC